MVGNLVVVFQCSAGISMAPPASGVRDAVLVFDTGIAEPGWLFAPRYPRERSDFSAALTNGDVHWYQTSKSGGNPCKRRYRAPAKVWKITSRCPTFVVAGTLSRS